jgi:hypothetical protein
LNGVSGVGAGACASAFAETMRLSNNNLFMFSSFVLMADG